MTPNAEEDPKVIPFPKAPPKRWRPGHVPERLISDLLADTPPPAKQRKVG